MRPFMPMLVESPIFMRTAAYVAVLLAFALPMVAQAKPAKPAKSVGAAAAKTVADSRHTGLVAAAAKGDDEAQHQLGQAYRDGHGVKADGAAALVWFGLAAANGNPRAATDAARMLEAGQGVARDMERAGQFWLRAARLGDTVARAHWEALLLDGKIKSLGGLQGTAWIADLAGNGNLRAAMILAEAFEHGYGVARNADEAGGWYRLAAQIHADPEARFRLGRLLLSLPAAWRQPDGEEWNPKEAERRNRAFGAVWLAAKPTDGADKALQLRPGMVEGGDWLEMAARAGHAEAQYTLGMALTGGIELPLDMSTGIGWLEAAAAHGHAEAMVALGDLANKGQGFFAKDPVRAYVLYDLAAAQGEEGAAEARDGVAKTLSQKQVQRARQLVQDLRDVAGM